MSLAKVKKNRSRMAAGPHNVIGGRGPAGLPFPGSPAHSELKAHASPAGCLSQHSYPCKAQTTEGRMSPDAQKHEVTVRGRSSH